MYIGETRRWDGSAIGYIFVTKTITKRIWHKADHKKILQTAEKVLRGEIV
jgi:hypothetical protein